MNQNPFGIKTHAVATFAIFTITYIAFFGSVAKSDSDSTETPKSHQAKMTNKRLGELLKQHFPTQPFQQGSPGVWLIQVDGDPDKQNDAPDAEQAETENKIDPDEAMNGVMMVMTDERANRMRIMMPIKSFDPSNENDLKLALIALNANYDRALDARYAINDGILWSAFIHPLGSLTEDDLESAIKQVRTLRKNTGTSYSSGALLFAPKAGEPPAEGDKEDFGDDPTV